MLLQNRHMEPSYEEYSSIHNEIIERTSVGKQLAWQAIGFFIAALAASITLRVVPYNNTITEHETLAFFDFASSVVMIFPAVVILSLASKSGENLRQVVSISCYIRVFYENNPRIKKQKWMMWETANNSLSMINVDKGKKSAFYKSPLYSEYTILTAVAVILYVLFSGMSILKMIIAAPRWELIILCSVYGIILILGICIVFKTYNVSCHKNNMMQMEEYYTDGYLRFARAKNIFTDDEIAEIENGIIIILNQGDSKDKVMSYKQYYDYIRRKS